MNIILTWEKYEVIFKNTKITMELLPLRRRQMLLLTTVFKTVGKEDIDIFNHVANRIDDYVKKNGIAKEEATKNIFKEDPELQAKNHAASLRAGEISLENQVLAKNVFPDFVRKVDGVTINGKVPTAEQFAEESVLCELTIKILSELMIRTTVTFADEKNSEGPSTT